ncbi:MAG: ATP-binding cassette domain-containing protein [Terricaulis sp.]|nr:ATP-binding cassette domain-containing protein [Terricaulis sp.]
MSSPAISLRGVRKSFDGGASFAVDAVSIDVAEGEFLAIIGGSGSGKTTTLRMINRLIEPDLGEVLIEGQSAFALAAHELRRRIGYVIQGVGLFPHLSIAENIAVTPRLLGWPREQIEARTRELLDLVELPAADYAARMPAALSGGQRQRIGVARALAARPRIVLMDEPFGALDPLTRDTLTSAYRALHDKLGVTSVMITHDIQEALLLADRLAVMADGKLIALGAPADLAGGDAPPQVRALLDMPRRQAKRVRERLADG